MPELPLGPLMVDIAGTVLGADERVSLSQPAVGAVILFHRNFQDKAQLRNLIREIKSIRTPPLLVAVDQEGGRVQRFREGFFRLPAANQLGKMYDDHAGTGTQLARCAGFIMAAELVEVGVDFSFAPVLDCANPASHVIGTRGFHENPWDIAVLAGAFIAGMHSAGMKATGKHFPGHGSVVEDSHFTLPVDNRPLDDLRKRDLVPYAALSHQLDGIMTAHIVFNAMDPNPATFSGFWLHRILRDELGFKGVVFSDDLSMKGADLGGDGFERTSRALQSGCDIVLICNDPETAHAVAGKMKNPATAHQNRLLPMYAAPDQKTAAAELDAAREQLAVLS